MSVKASALEWRNGRETSVLEWRAMGVKASVCEGSDARENEFMQGQRRARKLVYWRTAMGVKANEC